MACIFCNQDVQTLRTKRKMYVWTCTKRKTWNCNVTCYIVQYVCIDFDWRNFCAERNMYLFHTYSSDPYLYCAIPYHSCSLKPPLFSLRCSNCQVCKQPWYIWIWFICVAHPVGTKRQCAVSNKLMLYGIFIQFSKAFLQSHFSAVSFP